jgi:tetratricopeptide (TPR) repeat protein
VAASLGALLLSGGLQLAATPAPVRRPSVVLITLDTTRADRLGCYGRPGAGTPNLDRLAAREVYDLAGDPGQTKNLYAEGDALSQELAGRFDALASKLAERAGQGLPVPISDEERAKLASLGYVSGSPSAVAHPTLDPKDVVEIADLLDRGRELRKNGQPGEALTIAEEILRKNPENVLALSLRGQALLSQKRFRDAAAAFGAAVARNPKLAANRFDLGSSLAGAGDTTQAEAEWRRAIELEPHFAEPRASLIAAARERGDVAGALTLAKEAAASGTESAELNFEIGLAYAIAEDRAAAKRWFESAVRLRPDYVAALSNLGRIAYDDRRFDEALARFRAASAAAPGEAMFHEQIAVILLDDKHDRAGALDAYREALAVEHDPQEQARLEQAIAELAHE